jgi:TolA-binding protein
MSEKRAHTVEPPATDMGTPVEVMPLEAAELAASSSQQRRRRLRRWVVGAAIVVGLTAGATQVKLGGGWPGTQSRDTSGWESGMSLIEAGRQAEGLAALENAVATAPQGTERAGLHLRLAGVYRTLGEQQVHYLNSAVRHYTAVLESPEGVEPVDELLYETAMCFLRLGSFESAMELFGRIDDEFPSSTYRPQARFEVGECLAATGQYQQARQVFSEVAEAYRGEPLGEQAFFRFADSFNEQAEALKKE